MNPQTFSRSRPLDRGTRVSYSNPSTSFEFLPSMLNKKGSLWNRVVRVVIRGSLVRPVVVKSAGLASAIWSLSANTAAMNSKSLSDR